MVSTVFRQSSHIEDERRAPIGNQIRVVLSVKGVPDTSTPQELLSILRIVGPHSGYGSPCIASILFGLSRNISCSPYGSVQKSGAPTQILRQSLL